MKEKLQKVSEVAPDDGIQSDILSFIRKNEKNNFGKTWRYGASIPGPFECKSNALPLSYTPVP